MKRICILIALIGMICVSIRLMSGTKSEQNDFVTELAKKGAAWRSTNQLSLASTNLISHVRALAEARTNGLDAVEIPRLAEAVGSWFTHLKERDFNSFLRFRRADSCVFDSNATMYLHYAMGEKAKEIEALSANERAQALFGVVNTFQPESIAAGTFSLTISRIATAQQLKSGYRGSWLTKHYKGGILSEYQSVSPYRFAISPKDVLQRDGTVKLAQTGGVLVSADKRYAIPWYVSFFWSPSEELWKPFEYFGFDAAPRAPDKQMPRLFF